MLSLFTEVVWAGMNRLSSDPLSRAWRRNTVRQTRRAGRWRQSHEWPSSRRGQRKVKSCRLQVEQAAGGGGSVSGSIASHARPWLGDFGLRFRARHPQRQCRVVIGQDGSIAMAGSQASGLAFGPLPGPVTGSTRACCKNHGVHCNVFASTLPDIIMAQRGQSGAGRCALAARPGS